MKNSSNTLPPQFVYDYVRKLRNQGMSDNEISQKVKIRLCVVQGIK